ncbi:MAG TPA: mechanosensitive ion channel domain-containing protein [Candidatus Baltobacteraceae bacterium]|nr:mechanosensitive ion channel domain-containing protein [Candidatus Baltobacteraceae bacterium]
MNSTLLFHDGALTGRAVGALIVLVLTLIFARVAGVWVARLGQRTEHRLFSISLYATLVQTVIVIVGLLTVLSTLGIRIEAVLTTLGLGGLAVALALNDTLTNLFAGIQIITAKQLRVGDYVRFDFAEGVVADIQWHNTTLRDPQNDLVVIPNAKVNTSVFTNFSHAGENLVIPVTASLPWKGSFSKLKAIATKAAGGADVRMTAINETNVQVTAFLPAQGYTERSKRAAQFLEQLHDSAVQEHMGVSAGP